MAAETRHDSLGLHITERPGDRSAPPVVIVHGGMDRSSSFGRVVRRLGETPVVLYDRRGYGRSALAGTTDLEGHLADLGRVVDGRPSVLVGHSIGGVLALLLAQREPELVLSALVYEPPAPWFDWWPVDPSPVDRQAVSAEDEAERFMRRMVGDRIWERLPPRTRADRRAEGGALRSDVDSLQDAASVIDLHAVHAPLCAAAGSESPPWYRRGAPAIAAAVGDGRAAEVVGAGHGVHLSHPTEFADLIRSTRRDATPGLHP